MTPVTKRCADCKQELPTEAFVRDTQRPDGLSAYCRSCRSARDRAYRARVKAAHPKRVPPASKVCGRCKQVLPASAFSVRRHSPDGLVAMCKRCDSAVSTAWRRAHPEAVAARNARVRLRRRKQQATDPA